MTSVRIAAAPRRGIGTRFGPWVLAASLLSGACSDPEPALRSVDETDGGPNAGVSVDAGLVDAGGAADAGGTADAGTAGLPDLGPIDNGPPAVRFVALGDTGEGNTAQYEVSRAIETVCLVQGCDFALLLGDNFYDHGVDSVDDEQFRAKFEEPYANLQIPFWVTLGNHDFGEVPVQFWRTSYQIEYSMRSWKWNLPDHFYRFVADHVTFVSVDTNMIMLGLEWVRDQRGWMREQLAAVETPWVVAFGHHPWRSNGGHGNAGNYDGLGRLDITGLVSGRRLAEFFAEELCAGVDLYLSGHDHNRQVLEAPDGCRTELVVSGAGSKLDGLERRDGNPTRFEEDGHEGFFWFEITDRALTMEAWRKDGTRDFRRTLQR